MKNENSKLIKVSRKICLQKINNSSSHIQKHIDGETNMFVYREHPDLIQVKLQFRHVSSR